MATTVNLKKLLHRKSWEFVTPAPIATAAGSFVVADKYNLLVNSLAYLVVNLSSIWRYDGDEDSWVQIPNSGLAGTFGAGACGELRALGALGGVFTQTATGGGVSTINTNRTIVRNLAGRRIRVIAGTGLGFDGTVVSNTTGANAIITTSGSTTFDATTQYQVFSGSLWVQSAGASAGFGVYDVATNTWTAKTAVGLTWGTDGCLTSTIGAASSFATGTATSATSTTLVQSDRSWATNQWANSQVRITSGTGTGQIREIASNTATALTVATAWAITPDATSQYAIEANEDHFYLIGNAAVTMYRFKVSTNAWTTLAPTGARGAAPGAGATLNWIDNVPNWNLNANGSPVSLGQGLSKQNGRYLFSFRGGASASLDVYDISLNNWISGLAYGNQTEGFTTGSSNCDFDGSIYLQKEATGRIFRFNIDAFAMQSIAYNPVPPGTTVIGNKMFMLPYVDGATKLSFLYTLRHTGTEMFRMMLF